MNGLAAVWIAAAAYLTAFGAALWWSLGADPAEAWLCFGPAVLAVALGATSQADRRQYVVRLFALAMFGTIGLLMWASSHERAGWWLLLLLAAALAAFFALLFWLARFTTRIHPAAFATVGADLLVRRLRSLAGPGSGFEVTQASSGQVCVDARDKTEPARLHRITLAIDERRREVRVRELLAASGARPRDAGERSMRAAGEPFFDPARPDAQAVWARTWQATMIVPEALQATAVKLEGDRAHYDAKLLERDADALVTLLAAVVTRSGYAWQPSLLAERARASRAPLAG